MFRYLIFVCFLLFLSQGCKKQNLEYDNIFRYNQIGGLETLDPAFAKNLSIMWGVKFIYNTLIEVDSSLQIQPSLAKKWHISDDGLRYTFILRDSVFFHDNEVFHEGKGRKMTAHDVVYSFSRLTAPQTASTGAWIFNDRVSKTEPPFQAIDDTTFVINLHSPFRPLIEILSMPYCSIVAKEAVDKWGKDFRNNPCGTGPFRLQYWDEGNVLSLKKHEQYWEKDAYGKSLPYLSGVQISFHETRIMEFLLFKQQKLDFINGIDGSMKDLILTKKGTLRREHQDAFKLNKSFYLNTEYIGIIVDTNNTSLKNNPLKIKKVRQAVNYAIDRQKIVTYFRNGIGRPGHGGFIPIGMPGSADSTDSYGYHYHPQKAAQLLLEAGFPEGKGLNEITLNTPEVYVDIANFVAGQLSDIGIITKVQVMQPGILRQLMSRTEVPLFKAQWIADYPDAETFLAFFYSEFPAPPNYTRFAHPDYDRLYLKSLETIDHAERYRLYQQADSLMMDEAPVIVLFYDEILHFTQNNIQGLHSNAMNIIHLKNVQKK